MAIINCPECGKEISDKANSCPNCGCPLEKQEAILKETIADEVADDVKEEQQDNELLNAKTSTKKDNKMKCGIIVGAIIIVAGVGIFLGTANSRKYTQATKDFENGIYESAMNDFKELADYKDSASMYNMATYSYAQALYAEEKYEDAKKYFEEISDYEDSKDMISKCDYNMTLDGQFMIALSKGLMARWDYSNGGYEQEFSKDIAEMDSSEYMKYLKGCINCELDLLSAFESEVFLDEKLSEKANAYIKLLNDSLEVVDYYAMDSYTYSTKWDKIYSERVVMVRDFVEDYNLIVDESHQSTMDEFITNASVVDKQRAFEETIEKMLSDSELTPTIDEWGDTEYVLKLKNTTDVTFEYFYVELNVLDENGNIIDSGSVDSINSWKPGQEAQVDAYFYGDTESIEGKEIEMIAQYSIED